MGDEHDRLLQAMLDAQELVLHLPPDQGVEGRERLVEKPELGLDGERPGDADPLLLSARELARECAFAAFEPHEPDHPAHPFVAFGGRPPLEREGQRDVVEHVQVRHEPEALEDHPHLVPPDLDELPVGLPEQVLAVEAHFAVARLHEAGEAADDGRLPGAGKPHDDEDLADVDVEAHVDHGRDRAVAAHPGGERPGIARGDLLPEIGSGFVAVDLPDLPAGQLDLRGVRGSIVHVRCSELPALRFLPERYAGPVGVSIGGAGLIAGQSGRTGPPGRAQPQTSPATRRKLPPSTARTSASDRPRRRSSAVSSRSRDGGAHRTAPPGYCSRGQ